MVLVLVTQRVSQALCLYLHLISVLQPRALDVTDKVSDKLSRCCRWSFDYVGPFLYLNAEN